MTEKKTHHLSDLVAQCDPNAPMPEVVREWDQAMSVGLEQTVMGDQVDIWNAVLVFRDKLTAQFDTIQLILFGSRARGDHHDESDADVAVILNGQPGNFLDTKLAMADLAFDVLTETDVLIQALPVWESEWRNPGKYSNPDLLHAVARDGIILWQR